jgi:flagellar hook-associated protein 3
MRVTNNMIYDRTMFNLSRNLDRYMDVQTMVSSGRRINTPSDDPIGTNHDLHYRTRLSDIEQYLSNISQASGWMGTYDNGLGDLKNLYSSAKEIALMMANDTYDDTARGAAANEVQGILDQVLQLGNGDVDGRYIYAGHRTRTKPLEASANGVVYRGDNGAIELQIDVSSRIVSNLTGDNVFLKQLNVLGADADLHAGLLGTTLVADLKLGQGIDLSAGTFEIYDNNRNTAYTIDISGATTVDDIVNAINTQLGPAANLTVKISDVGAALVWEPTTGATNTVTVDTPISNLNGGAGIDLNGGRFLIRNADSSIRAEVDVSGASTVGDVIASINSSLAASGITGVTAGLNSDGTGLALSDTNVPPLGLVVEEVTPGFTTAYDLGLLGPLTPTLEGRDLNPQPDFEIRDIGSQTLAADLGIAGSVQSEKVGGDLQPLLTTDTLLSSLNNKSGYDIGQIKISQGDQIALVDLSDSTITTVGDLLNAINSCGLEVTASINDAGTGIQIVSDLSDRTFIVENSGDTRTANTLGVIGSSDMLGSLMLLVTALQNNDRETAEHLVGNMDFAMNELLASRATVGSRMKHMDTTQNRLESSQTAVTQMLSDVEDADMVTAVSDLAKQENLYKAALMASSSIMQYSLVDFLR